MQPLFAYQAFCGTRSSLVVHAMSDFTVDGEIRMMELELALLNKKRAMAEQSKAGASSNAPAKPRT